MEVKAAQEKLRQKEGSEEARALTRLASFLVDIAILYAITLIFGGQVLAGDGSVGLSLDTKGVFICLVYYIGFECSPLRGTLGKLIFGIIVTDEYGSRLSFGKAFLRLLGRVVTFMTLFIGMFIMFFREDRRTLHDIMSSTYVLKK